MQEEIIDSRSRRRKAEQGGEGGRRLRRLGPLRGKRPRDRELAEEWEMEQLARGDEQPISVISITGPPWFDEYSGKQLDEDGVMKAMEKEMTSFKSFDVTKDVPEEEAVNAGIEIIPSRWLIHDRGGEGDQGSLCGTANQ